MDIALYLLAIFIFIEFIFPIGRLMLSQHRAFTPKTTTRGKCVNVCTECYIENRRTTKSFGDPLIRILLYTDGSIDLRGNKRDIERLRKIVYEYHVRGVRYSTAYGSPLLTSHYSRVEPWETWPAAGERFVEAVCLALQDPACHKPSDWIFVPPQQGDRIAS